MKRLLFPILLALVVCMAAQPQINAQYRLGGQWGGLALTVGAGPLGFGAQYENGFDHNISLGGMVRYWGWSYEFSSGIELDITVIHPEFFANYHFQPGEQFDPYIGASIGFMLYSSSYTSPDRLVETFSDNDDSEFTLGFHGGTRYFFNREFSGRAELEIYPVGPDYRDFNTTIMIRLGADYTF